MVEQVFHVLKPHGTFAVWSPYESDDLFAPLLKKVFGRVHTPPHGGDVPPESVLWGQREGERPTAERSNAAMSSSVVKNSLSPWLQPRRSR